MSPRRTISRLPLAGSDSAKIPLHHRPQPDFGAMRPTFAEARPARIAAALAATQRKPSGGWYVVGRSADVGSAASVTRTVAGREVALWRATDGSLRAGPGACPHLGALLQDCPVLDGDLVCRWHGLRLSSGGYGDWRPFVAYDDGALLWVRLPSGDESDEATDRPYPSERPPLPGSLVAVITRRAMCEPDDIIANRLDPWHGAWFHPYSFSHLDVDDQASTEERLIVDVTFRLGKRFGVPVRAEFVTPDPRTIVMRIIDGEGVGSVVETHATPITAPDQPNAVTVMTEATIAHGAGRGFGVARSLGPLLRPAMRHVARRLWVDDLIYAERRYALRRRGEFPG